MEKLELKINEGVTDVIIREGSAATLIEPRGYHIQGDIRTVANWLLTKLEDTDITKAFIRVDMKHGKLELNLNLDQENHRLHSTVKGSFSTHPDLGSFRINNNFGWDVIDLGNHFKFMRRYFFEKEANMALVSGLKSFKATVNRELEKQQDDRGNHRRLDDKRVTTNLPEVFTLYIPIFEGHAAQAIDVEMVIEEKEGVTRVKLQSVDLIEKTESLISEAITAELARLSSIENLTIIYE